jgi:hypothetical protein
VFFHFQLCDNVQEEAIQEESGSDVDGAVRSYSKLQDIEASKGIPKIRSSLKEPPPASLIP